MLFVSFHARFPEIAEKETYILTVMDSLNLPKGLYGLLEMYCNEPGCDCRRVFFDVYDWQRRKSMAIIAYGWEDETFYANWFKYSEPTLVEIQDMRGPILNPGSPQSKYAPAFLASVTEMLQNDTNYVARLQRHYQMFKEAVDSESRPSRQGLQSKQGSKPRKRKKKKRRRRR